MPKSWTIWLIGALMAIVAVAAQFAHPKPAPDLTFQLEAAIPRNFGDWRIDPDMVTIPPSPDAQAKLDKIYDQILTRTYVNSAGEHMMLVIAYGGDQSDSLKAHRQEVCYAAQGFGIRDIAPAVLTISGSEVPAVHMHAVKPRRSEPVTYWFTMGNHVVMGRAERLAMQIVYGLAGKIPDGLLVRVSSFSNDADAAYGAQTDFLRQLLAAVDEKTRLKLAGLR